MTYKEAQEILSTTAVDVNDPEWCTAMVLATKVLGLIEQIKEMTFHTGIHSNPMRYIECVDEINKMISA